MDPTETQGGYSFPTTGGRLLLGPEIGELGGVPVATAPPEPAPVADPSPPPAADIGQASRPDFNSVDLGVASGSPAQPSQPLAPADPNQAAGATTNQQFQSLREAAIQAGYRFHPSIVDDSSALSHLIQRANQSQQADVYAQLGRQLAPHADRIQQMLGQQQTQAPPARPAWEPPPFDERWASLVEQTPQGVYVGKQGTPVEIVNAVNEYADWMKAYNSNPWAVHGPAVQAEATRIATEVVRREMAQAQTHSAVQSILASNAEWLYQSDQNGNRAYGPNNQPALSPLGIEYQRYIQVLSKAGVHDPNYQDSLAKEHLRGLIARSQGQQGGVPSQAAQVQSGLAGARPNVNPLQAVPPLQRLNTPGATPPSTTGMSLREQLSRAMEAEGVTDAEFANVGGG